ncbi:MAG: HAD-IA family hydrolase [Phycisphaerae bacterium]
METNTSHSIEDIGGLATLTGPLRRCQPPKTDIGAFLFDVDGVIADTAGLHADAWHRLADEAGLPFDSILPDAFRGISREASLKKLLGDRRVTPERFDEMLDRKNRLFQDMLEQLGPTDRLPGVDALFQGLRRFDIRLAAVSASRNARTVLQRLDLIDAFEIILDGNNEDENPSGLHRFARAAAGLRVTPDRCVVVEDATAGIAAARQLGMKSIGIGSSGRLCAATLVFESLRGVDAGMLLGWLSKPS